MTARIQSPLQCVHCHTTETPLWRAGPTGPKTLCNACGVRWKKTGSVIPRAKRSSSGAGSAAASSKPSSTIRKRARTTAASVSNAVEKAVHNNANNQSSSSGENNHHQGAHHSGNHGTGGKSSAPSASDPAPPPHPVVDPAARVAAAALPAPRPISVFRVSDAQRSKYESVFSGLMVIQRSREVSSTQHHHHSHSHSHTNHNTTNHSGQDSLHQKKHDRPDSASTNSTSRTRTQTPKASAFFSDLSQQNLNSSQQQQHGRDQGGEDGSTGNENELIPTQRLAGLTGGKDRSVGFAPASPSPSPPPIDLSLASALYMAGVHAPSPSPSPPPMPRKRVAEGGSFRLVLSTIADKKMRE